MHCVLKHAPPPLFSLNHVPRWIEKLVVRKARNVISISRDVEDFLRDRKSLARSFPIPNAMAPCFFEGTAEPRPTGQYALLYVGAIEPRKGLLYLVEALARLRDSFPDSLTLRVIGSSSDSYKQSVVERAAALK